jgi:hypothetical protein
MSVPTLLSEISVTRVPWIWTAAASTLIQWRTTAGGTENVAEMEQRVKRRMVQPKEKAGIVCPVCSATLPDSKGKPTHSISPV